jgi:hypothetical protein
MADIPVIDLGLTNHSSGKSCGGCIGLFIAVSLLIVSAGFLAKHIIASRETLTLQPACGSPPNQGSNWYAVLGQRSSLNLVKKAYCADAFVSSNGYIQVASFTSRSKALEFATTLSRLTGEHFWVP